MNSPAEGKRRSYEMANRARQAAETRRRIVESAGRLFVRDGYSATSVPAIAAEAGVAVPTVYASVGSKPNVLRAVVQLTVRGDDDAAPLADRDVWRSIEAEADAHLKLAAFARLHRGICDREAAVFGQLEAAAGSDTEASELLAEHDRQRYEMHARLARNLARQGILRAGISVRAAADLIWTLASERTYLALVGARGWSPAAYERWLCSMLEASLLPS